jgi:hypothetical protein
VNGLVGCHHDEVLKNRAKMHRYGRWVAPENGKTTGFSGVDGLFKKRGSGTEGSKMRIPARKHRSLWFFPAETTRILAETEPNHAETM